MYEIWLVMNIGWEIALGVWPLLAAGLLCWLALLAFAWRQPGARWRSALPLAAGLGAAATAVGFLWVPTATRSSLQEMAYWVDWANLVSLALGIGAATLAFVWPATVLWRRISS